jgi:hypothetical protein
MKHRNRCICRKILLGRVDVSPMGTLSTAMLLVFLLASGITVLAMMRVFTNIVEHETDLHDLRNRIKHLQFERQLYLARLHGHIGPEEEGEIEILENDPIEAVERAEDAAAQAVEIIEQAQAA